MVSAVVGADLCPRSRAVYARELVVAVMSETQVPVVRKPATAAEILGKFWQPNPDDSVSERQASFQERLEAMATHDDVDAHAVASGRARICHRH